MTVAAPSLEGLTFTSSPPHFSPNMTQAERAERRLLVECATDILQEARALRANICSIQDNYDGGHQTVSQRHTGPSFMVSAAIDTVQVRGRHDAAVTAALRQSEVYQARHWPVTSAGVAQAHELIAERGAVMLAATIFDRGHSKYLLETPKQLQRVSRLLRDHPDELRRTNSEFREYITTPSQHFTSFRALTSPVGDLLAASLIYSPHHKTDDVRITEDRMDDVAGEYERAQHVRALKQYFEVPSSPYYLHARDVRSNIATGGRAIPLMGGLNARPISPEEAAILRSHNINPRSPAVPERLVRAARIIGATLGPQTDLVLGQDYVQEVDGQQRLIYIESNAEPGSNTFDICWNRGQGLQASLLEMRSFAFKSIVAHFNGEPFSIEAVAA